MPTPAERATAATLNEAATRAHLEVMRAGREVVQQSSTRWRRVTDGNPCGFCAMLASRGPVYRTSSVGQYHTRCGCTVEPFEGNPGTWKPTPEEQRYIDAYDAARRPGQSLEELVDGIENYLTGDAPGVPLRVFNPDTPDGFTASEAEAVKDYQGVWYQYVNGPLRSGAELEPRAAEIVTELDSVIGSSAVEADTIAFRGLYERPPGMTPGSEFVDNGFASTSLNEDYVRRIYAEGEDAFLLRLRVPRGTEALRIDTPKGMTDLSDYFQEDELLLGRGKRFRVISETKGAPGEPSIMDIEVVP